MSISEAKVQEVFNDMLNDLLVSCTKPSISTNGRHRRKLDTVIAGLLVLRNSVYQGQDAGEEGNSQWTSSESNALEDIADQVTRLHEEINEQLSIEGDAGEDPDGYYDEEEST